MGQVGVDERLDRHRESLAARSWAGRILLRTRYLAPALESAPYGARRERLFDAIGRQLRRDVLDDDEPGGRVQDEAVQGGVGSAREDPLEDDRIVFRLSA